MFNSLKKYFFKPKKVPKHIAVIMDGNGRWAKERNLPRISGHREGINSVRQIVQICGELGISYYSDISKVGIIKGEFKDEEIRSYILKNL